MFVKDLKEEFYKKLVGNRILVIVNHDVDAVCSARILRYLLETDNIQYVIVPVQDLRQLMTAFWEHQASVQHIILINIGAGFDLYNYLSKNDGNIMDDKKIIFVADNHQPVDVYNVYRHEVRLLMKESESINIPLYEEVFDDSEDEEEDEDEELANQFSIEQLEKRKKRRIWNENRKKIIFDYNQFSYFGQSIAYFFFKVAHLYNRDNNELLWLAIVGVCDLHVNGKIELSAYESSCRSLNQHLKRLTNTRGDYRNNSMKIFYVKDLQLVLYRQWSLFESLRHTIFTGCKFKVWNVKGQNRMLEFLAEVGIPLVQCKQKYFAMDLEYRKSIQEWIDDLTEKYNMKNIISDSFVNSLSYKHKFNACDVSLAVRSLLESPLKNMTTNEKFLQALDSLSTKNFDLLHKGFEYGKIQLEATLKFVHDTIDMKNITSAGPFLYTIIEETLPDAKLFCFPGSLVVMTKFLLNAYVVSAKRPREAMNMPLVMIAPDMNKEDFALAVGHAPIAEASTKSFFGKAFEQAAELLDIEIEADFFDASVIRFKYEDRMKLIEGLTSCLS